MVHKNSYKQKNRGIICIRETNYFLKIKESEGPFIRLYTCNTTGEMIKNRNLNWNMERKYVTKKKFIRNYVTPIFSKFPNMYKS